MVDVWNIRVSNNWIRKHRLSGVTGGRIGSVAGCENSHTFFSSLVSMSFQGHSDLPLGYWRIVGVTLSPRHNNLYSRTMSDEICTHLKFIIYEDYNHCAGSGFWYLLTDNLHKQARVLLIYDPFFVSQTSKMCSRKIIPRFISLTLEAIVGYMVCIFI